MDTFDVNLKKKKRRKLFTNIAIASALSFAVVGVGVVTIYNNDYQITKAVEYDDEEYSIYLTAYELTNYSFVHFQQYLTNSNDAVDDIIAYANYYSDEYALSDYGLSSISDTVYFSFTYGSYNIYFNYDFLFDGSINKFLIDYDDELTDFEYDLTIFVIATYYNDVKNAIELDIQANQSYTNNTFLHDIIELLVGGIGVTASGIGVGLSTLVSNLAIQNGAMSPFMAIVLIFGGIALAFGLSRWVVNLISSLGQRNR